MNTTSNPSSRSIRTGLATVVALGLGATLAVGTLSPVQAEDSWSVSAIRLESDSFTVKDPTLVSSSPAATVTGTAIVSFDRGHVRVGVWNKLTRLAAGAGCRAARVVFTYADNSTSTVTSPRLCKEFGTTLSEPRAWSRTDREVVRYAVQILAASDSTAPLAVVAGSTQFVGDAPDSLGTAARLDHDTNVVTMPYRSGRTATVFTGSTDYYLQRHEVSAADFTWFTSRARVAGTLTWSDMLTGTEAYLSIHWTYVDGSTSSTLSPPVVRGSLPTRTISLTSSSTKHVVAVSMAVYSNQAGYGSVSNGSQGHFLDPSTGQ